MLYVHNGNNSLQTIDPLGMFVVDPALKQKYPRVAERIATIAARIGYRSYQSIRRWGMVCPVDLTKSREFIRRGVSYGTGPMVVGANLSGRAVGHYPGGELIQLDEWWLDALQKNLAIPIENIDVTVVHEFVHYTEHKYSRLSRGLARYTGAGSDGSRIRSGYTEAAQMYDFDILGRKASFTLIAPYEQIKDQLLPLQMVE